jgi:hypothetical protein
MKSARLFALALLFFMAGVQAATLPGGTYRGTVEFGDILLAGRYPFEVDGWPAGVMELQTSPTGVVTAEVFFLGEKEEAVGSIRVRDGRVRLVLRGRVERSRVRVNATLQGSAFVGTAVLRGKESRCRLLVSGIAPIRADFTLALSSPADGQIAGAGVLRAGTQQLRVTARGRIVGGKLALTLTAGKATLKLSGGTFTSQGFVAAKWTAQGFGALRKGRNLPFKLAR